MSLALARYGEYPIYANISKSFTMEIDNVNITETINRNYLGKIEQGTGWSWFDALLVTVLGGITNQPILQRALACRTDKEGKMVMFFGSLSSLLLVIPALVIGAVATMVGKFTGDTALICLFSAQTYPRLATDPNKCASK
jgi:uncharacterized sodium:solute symporter family permease YidK